MSHPPFRDDDPRRPGDPPFGRPRAPRPVSQPQVPLDPMLLKFAQEQGYLEEDPMIKKFNELPENQPETVEGGPVSQAFGGLRSAARRYVPDVGATMQSIGEATNIRPLTTAGAALEVETRRRPLVGRVPSMYDINGVRDAIDWAAFSVGSGVGSMLPMIGATALGGPAAGLAAGASMNVSESRSKMQELGVPAERIGAASLITGGAATGLDYLPVGMLMGRLRPGSALPAAAGAAGLRAIGTAAAKQGGAEFLTEGAQEVVQNIGGYTAAGRMPTSAERGEIMRSTLENAVAGGLTGGVAGGGAQTFNEIGTRLRNRQTAQPQQPAGDATSQTQTPEEAPRGIRRAIAEVIDPSVRQLEEQRDVARRAAETDPMTGLANRGAFDRAIPTAEADPNTAVIIVDANGFKRVNDVLGHKTGDATLKDIGSALTSAAGENGRVFRIGGDEFAVLAPVDKAIGIRDGIEATFGVRDLGDGVRVSVSGGIGATMQAADMDVMNRKTRHKAEQNIGRRTPGIPQQVVPPPVVPQPEGVADAAPESPRVGAPQPLSETELDELASLYAELQELEQFSQVEEDPTVLEQMAVRSNAIVDTIDTYLSNTKFVGADGLPYTVKDERGVNPDYERQLNERLAMAAGADLAEVAGEEQVAPAPAVIEPAPIENANLEEPAAPFEAGADAVSGVGAQLDAFADPMAAADAQEGTEQLKSVPVAVEQETAPAQEVDEKAITAPKPSKTSKKKATAKSLKSRTRDKMIEERNKNNIPADRGPDALEAVARATAFADRLGWPKNQFYHGNMRNAGFTPEEEKDAYEAFRDLEAYGWMYSPEDKAIAPEDEPPASLKSAERISLEKYNADYVRHWFGSEAGAGKAVFGSDRISSVSLMHDGEKQYYVASLRGRNLREFHFVAPSEMASAYIEHSRKNDERRQQFLTEKLFERQLMRKHNARQLMKDVRGKPEEAETLRQLVFALHEEFDAQFPDSRLEWDNLIPVFAGNVTDRLDELGEPYVGESRFVPPRSTMAPLWDYLNSYANPRYRETSAGVLRTLFRSGATDSVLLGAVRDILVRFGKTSAVSDPAFRYGHQTRIGAAAAVVTGKFGGYYVAKTYAAREKFLAVTDPKDYRAMVEAGELTYVSWPNIVRWARKVFSISYPSKDGAFKERYVDRPKALLSIAKKRLDAIDAEIIKLEASIASDDKADVVMEPEYEGEPSYVETHAERLASAQRQLKSYGKTRKQVAAEVAELESVLKTREAELQMKAADRTPTEREVRALVGMSRATFPSLLAQVNVSSVTPDLLNETQPLTKARVWLKDGTALMVGGSPLWMQLRNAADQMIKKDVTYAHIANTDKEILENDQEESAYDDDSSEPNLLQASTSQFLKIPAAPTAVRGNKVVFSISGSSRVRFVERSSVDALLAVHGDSVTRFEYIDDNKYRMLANYSGEYYTTGEAAIVAFGANDKPLAVFLVRDIDTMLWLDRDTPTLYVEDAINADVLRNSPLGAASALPVEHVPRPETPATFTVETPTARKSVHPDPANASQATLVVVSNGEVTTDTGPASTMIDMATGPVQPVAEVEAETPLQEVKKGDIGTAPNGLPVTVVEKNDDVVVVDVAKSGVEVTVTTDGAEMLQLDFRAPTKESTNVEGRGRADAPRSELGGDSAPSTPADVLAEQGGGAAGDGQAADVPEGSQPSRRGSVLAGDGGGAEAGPRDRGPSGAAVVPDDEGGRDLEPADEGVRVEPKPVAGDVAAGVRLSAGALKRIIPSGIMTRAKHNVSVIRLVKRLEAENRAPTHDERLMMLGWVGWGPVWQVFDPNKTEYAAVLADIKELLTPDEFKAAELSYLNAHYTSEDVVVPMLAALERFGIGQGARILEPSAGIGHFLTMRSGALNSSRWTAVELEPFTAKILRYLHPDQDVKNLGFEKLKGREGAFDAVIGNVPFGKYGLADPQYDKLKVSIHDYFLAKSIDQVRPGGLVMIVTSHYTMDARSKQEFRQYISDRAWFVGAIRLPETAFKGNAATEVVTDILVFQRKADGLQAPASESWHSTSELPVEGGKVRVNDYFLSNPRQVLGRLTAQGTMYSSESLTVLPVEDGVSLSDKIATAFENMPESIVPARVQDPVAVDKAAAKASLDAEKAEAMADRLREGEMGYDEQTGTFIIKVAGKAEEIAIGKEHQKRVRSLLGLRDKLRHSFNLQWSDADKASIDAALADLQQDYARHVKAHGPITVRELTKGGKIKFPGLHGLPTTGSDYHLLSTLEVAQEDGKAVRYLPSRVQKERVLLPQVQAKPRNVAEGLSLSKAKFAAVNTGWIAQQLNIDEDEVTKQLADSVLVDPVTLATMDRDTVISGDIRERIEAAEQLLKEGHPQSDEVLRTLVELRKVAPPRMEADEIGISPSANYIDADILEAFARHLFGARVPLQYLAHPSSQWVVGDAPAARASASANVQWGTKRFRAVDLLEKMLNGRKVQVVDELEDGTKVKNARETELASQKVSQMREAFFTWIRDPDNKEYLERIVERFNKQNVRYVRPFFDGSKLELPGTAQFYKNKAFEWAKHQRDAIARILSSRATLLAHVVGAGKTFVMAGAIMEGRRIGKFNRPMVVVPKHLVNQIASEFMALYPNAKVLATTPEDVDKEHRKAFAARVLSGDYDAIVMSDSSFSRLAMSETYTRQAMDEELAGIDAVIDQFKAGNGRDKDTLKQLQAAKKRVQENMEKMLNKITKDELLAFDELGIDAIFVDEAHNYKNLYAFSRRPEVSTKFVAKAFDMLMKTKYLHRTNGTIVFSTGTPVSNALYELHAMMRYLIPDALKKLGVEPLDAFLDQHAQVVLRMEMSPEGGRFRSMNRISQYENMKPLMDAFMQIADIRMASDLWPEPTAEEVAAGKKRRRPPMKGGKPTLDVAPATTLTRAFIRHLGNRADVVRAGGVDPSEDNMLKITGDGRKLALDPRLIDPRAPEPENGVIRKAAANILRTYRQYDDVKGTQIVFSDLGVPRTAAEKRKADEQAKKIADFRDRLARQGKSEEEIDMAMVEEFDEGVFNESAEDFADGGFDVYSDLKAKLVAGGIPASEIAFIHEANTDLQKKALFDKVNAGLVRVIIGSTSKMGAGTNVQERVVALHHLDVPWRPSDIEQREGRAIRQGNVLFDNGKIDSVEIVRYLTEGTFSTFMWDANERKAGFIDQLWTGAGVNTLAELGGKMELTAAEAKAIASGNPLAIEVAGMKENVTKLESKIRSARDSADNAKRRVNVYTEEIKRLRERVKSREQDLPTLQDVSGDKFTITIGDQSFKERGEAWTAMEQRIRDGIHKARSSRDFKPVQVVTGTFASWDYTLVVQQDQQGEFESSAWLRGPSGDEYEAMGAGGRGVISAMERIHQVIKNELTNDTLRLADLERELKAVKKMVDVDLSGETTQLVGMKQELAEKQKELEAIGEGDNVIWVPIVPERTAEWWAMAARDEMPYRKMVIEKDKLDAMLRRGGISLEDSMYGITDPLSLVARGVYKAARGFVSRLKADRGTNLHVATREEVETELQGAEGLMGKTWVQKMKEQLGRFRGGLRRFKWLDEKASALNAQLYDILLRVERAAGTGKRQAYNLIRQVTHKMTPDEMTLFARWLAFDDIMKDVEAGLYDNGKQLPFGFADKAELEDELRKVQEAVRRKPELVARRALRDKLVRNLTMRLVALDLLPEDVLLDPRYYHRQVMTYFNLGEEDSTWLQALRADFQQRVEVGSRGYQKSRVGGGTFNLRYVEAEFEWLSQAFRQVHTAEALNEIQSLADIRRDLAAQARATNRVNWFHAEREKLRKSMLAQGFSAVDIAQAIGALDPSVKYRQQKAIGFRAIYRGLANGTIVLPTRFQHFSAAFLAAYMDAQARAQLTGDPFQFDFQHPDLWRVLSHIGESNGPGAVSALQIFKAIAQEEKAIRASLGSAYIDRRNPESLMKLAPEGYATWQPVKGNYFFRAVTVEQQIVDEVLASQRVLQQSDVREVLAMGGPRETWIIPSDLAAQLEKFATKRERNVVEKALEPAVKRWKWMMLFAPWRVLKYTINNVAGDVDATMLYPTIMTSELGQASRDLWSAFVKTGSANPKVLEEMEQLELMGVIGNTLSATEIPDVSKLPEISTLIKANPLEHMNMMGRYVHLVDVLNTVRENALRVAAYRWALKQFKAGRMLVGASDAKVLVNLESSEAKAAMFARDLLGDYQAVSRAGESLSNGAMPFFRWVEINFKRYFNLAKNVRLEGNLRAGQVAGALSARAGIFTAVQAARVTVLANAFLVTAALWNALMFPEDDELLRKDGMKGYLILGRTADGEIIRIRAESAFGDFLNWIGMGDWPAKYDAYTSGELSRDDLLEDMAFAPLNRVWSSWDPFTKEVAEQIYGYRAYPDIRRPRPIRERGFLAGAANVFGASWVYKASTGRPVPPSWAPLSWILYRTDEEEAAYYVTKDLVRKYSVANGKVDRTAPQPAERDNALYYYRQAVRYGEHQMGEQWLKRYYELGGTREGAKQSLSRSAHPLSGIPLTERRRFMRSLSRFEATLVDKSVRYWEDRYGYVKPPRERALGVYPERRR